jgi:hypothetical protein
MKHSKFRIQNIRFVVCLFFTVAFFMSSCGYRIVGSTFLPFDAVTIKPVQNETYEPQLEDKMHIALSNEFINQGIEVKASEGNIDIEATITKYALGAIGAVDETVKEQQIIMNVDVKFIDEGEITEFRNMQSPIRITFQSTGTVGEAVARQEEATVKACREIAQEIVSKLIIVYAK